MNEVTYAHMLMNELDGYFDSEISWSEEYQDRAYDIVKIFESFENPEAAVVPILQGIERQRTSAIDWFAEFQIFLEQFDKEKMKHEYITSLQRKPTEMCNVLLRRLDVDAEEIDNIISNRTKRLEEAFN
ncbi:hypothetical protein [Enterococcus larvae]|uniref:hypothetical protein n=1 Tax=Enterococcus larvae TaxID=2794352 RepID=UPI003F2F704F